MFAKILIANRGEIACRIIRTAQAMGIQCVAVYSEADKFSQHVVMADEAVEIGPAPVNESYLRSERIVEVAKDCGAEAVHPGYGFLSENADFARALEKAGIVFIGPPADAIAAMGSKASAKRLMHDAEVPLIPGYHGEDQSEERLHAAADEMGYPVLIKASAGGGGRGMRPVAHSEQFSQALKEAQREAASSFGDAHMLIEKYLAKPRHVEVQVFCDAYGNGVYVFDRDCSIQRRHQKVIEEAPAPNLSTSMREAMGEAAVRAALAIGYRGAGTLEFLVDSRADAFYFMEMNTRLQVEHPVSEAISGLDLVEWQIRVAHGEVLPCTQLGLEKSGHAIEARLYAEDPRADFCPSTGLLEFVHFPESLPGVRIDTGFASGDEVSAYYDAMLAKIIAWGETREIARCRLLRALSHTHIEGVTTNLEFLQSLLSHEAMIEEKLSTHFIDDYHDALFNGNALDSASQALAVFAYLLSQTRMENERRPWQRHNAFRSLGMAEWTLPLLLNGQAKLVKVVFKARAGRADGDISVDGERFSFTGYWEHEAWAVEHKTLRQNLKWIAVSDECVRVILGRTSLEVRADKPDLGDAHHQSREQVGAAPMNGRVLEVLCKAGDKVDANTPLVIMEAMKMEHTLKAPKAGEIIAVHCEAGILVSGGQRLLEFEELVS